MHYDAYIHREGKHLLADFPDCPGCHTFADSGDELADAAQEAIEGWLEAHLVDGQVPPRPRERSVGPAGKTLARISIRAGLAAALTIRWAREDAGLSQAALGKRAGVRQQQIAKLEDPATRGGCGKRRDLQAVPAPSYKDALAWTPTRSSAPCRP